MISRLGADICTIKATSHTTNSSLFAAQKQRIMSSSMSLEYKAIIPPQSVECVPETETQDKIPETQESVSNLEIIYPDDYTNDDDDDTVECTGCTVPSIINKRIWYHCRSCLLTYDGFAQCCPDLDHVEFEDASDQEVSDVELDSS
jgi:hypothetical protein